MSKRRRRLALPWKLKAASIFMLLLPLFNYMLVAYQFHLPLVELGGILRQMNWLEIVLLLLPFAVGLGLLRAAGWGWWLAVVYSLVLSGYNLFVFLEYPVARNASLLAITIIGFAFFFFLIRKDTSAPYMFPLPRGWRRAHRHDMHIPIMLNDRTYSTRDLSEIGLYANAYADNLLINDTVKIKLGDLELEGGVVRIDSDGFGVAFRNLSMVEIQAVRDFVKQHHQNF